jgi:aspartyl-tRNA(Asn)/glutamyl-tRNA(Gln) amidotransferase subunit C
MNEPKVDIRALAALARMEVSDAEIVKLEQEIPSILGFIETIQAVSAEGRSELNKSAGLHNVMRDDINPHKSGIYTDTLLDQAPAREGNRLAVKQVLSRQKKTA